MSTNLNLDAIFRKANSVDTKQTLRKVWVTRSLVNILQSQGHGESDDTVTTKLQALLESILSQEKPTILGATEVRIGDLMRLFDLDIDKTPWTLMAEPHEVPQLLVTWLQTLDQAGYDDGSEATCRLAADLVLMACKLHLTSMFPIPSSAKRRKIQRIHSDPPSLDPGKDEPYYYPRKPLTVFPELDLNVTIQDPDDPDSRPIRVTGRADWAIGYGTRDTVVSGAVLIAVEAKRRSTFSAAESQLLSYLGILRELRINAGKENPLVQGFFTDGERYTFLAITNEGHVRRSLVYEVRTPAGLKTVFNFIVTILETACRSTPNTSPVKGEKRAKELSTFNKEVWVNVYGPGKGDIFGAKPEILMEEDGDLQEMPEFI